MLIKFNVSNVSITEVHTDITNNSTENTTLKIDSITLEQEVAPEEIGTLINSITNIAKDVITTSKDINTSKQDKRYHIIKTKDFPNGNGNILYYIWNRRTNSYYIKVGRTSIDIMSKEYFNESINEHKKAHRVIAEYDCNNFRL